ncbi:MOSC domain-containing protein [Nocardia neocaledoniensis]|uniref:MOSC domain-containing protein n=1 Tax=Nocardia neocaledoniensis TaxID=236511 RepID=UPI0031345BC6
MCAATSGGSAPWARATRTVWPSWLADTASRSTSTRATSSSTTRVTDGAVGYRAGRVLRWACGGFRLGENITTAGLDLLGLSAGTLLRIGPEAVVEVTGLRNPCLQIDMFRAGLLRQVAYRDEEGRVIRKAGIMGVVVAGGPVRPDDAITVEPPEGPHRPLERV